MDGIVNGTHPFCNLTTNKELSAKKASQETLHYNLPTTWLVCRVCFLVLLAALALLISREILIYSVSKEKGKKALEMFLLHHLQLPKLILLLISCVLRWTWFLDPYYVQGKYNMFGSTFAEFQRTYDILLRLPQFFFLFVVILLQIKSWRQTVRNTSKLRRSGGRRRTVRKSIVQDLPAVRTDNIVISLFILALVIATILNVSIFPHAFLYTATALILGLIPAAVYYVYKLRLLVLSLYNGKNSKKREVTLSHSKNRKNRQVHDSYISWGATLFIAAIFNTFIKPCKKGEYLGESIKYLIFIIMIHLLVEIMCMLAMFYTLYTKKRHEDSRSRKITNKYASSTGETESDAKSVSAITMIPSNPPLSLVLYSCPNEGIRETTTSGFIPD